MIEHSFLEKMTPVFNGVRFDLPMPSLSSFQRQQQRLIFRNNRVFHKAICSLSGKNMISMYDPDTVYQVYDQQVWWGDEWDPLSYGRDIDISKTFTQQFQELMTIVPRINLINTEHRNSEYCNFSLGNKDSYMLATSAWNDRCFYSTRIFTCSSCVDCEGMNECELCYESMFCANCYQCMRSDHCVNCRDCFACSDMYGCSDCFGSFGLHNAQYVIYNKQYTKEVYQACIDEHIKELTINPLGILEKLGRHGPHLVQCEKSTGDNLSSCNDCIECFTSKHLENCAYVSNATHLQDCWDIDNNDRSQLNYQIVGGEENYHCGFCDICRFGKELWYCSLCMYCDHCFACVGLKRASYCIFNKQYTPEEYEKQVAKLIVLMQETQERGEFFSASLSPFSYNETVAQDMYPLSFQEAQALGYRWRSEKNQSEYAGVILHKDSLPTIEDATSAITKQVIICAESDKLFRVVQQELDVYKKLSLPLPYEHPDIRHTKRQKRIMN